MGLLPSRPEPDTDVAVIERLPRTFIYSLELEGHPDQKYDMFILHCLLDKLRSEFWNVAFELAGVRRTDGFVRDEVASGGARYAVDLVVRSHYLLSLEALRTALENSWAELTAINGMLVNDKGTRDLLEPRMASLAAYVIDKSSRRRRPSA